MTKEHYALSFISPQPTKKKKIALSSTTAPKRRKKKKDLIYPRKPNNFGFMLSKAIHNYIAINV